MKWASLAACMAALASAADGKVETAMGMLGASMGLALMALATKGVK